MIDELKIAVNELLEGTPLSAFIMKSAVGAIMDGQCSEIEISSFLTALRCRGESVGELVGAASAMRERATPIVCRSTGLLDTCGTGGDLLHTFNISTAAALVAAAAGQPVAKHGNRGATSTTGSADVLEAMGVNLNLTPNEVGRCIDEVGIGFCFAPLLHGAMKHVIPVRKQLGFRTIFNMLGPLTNPARATYQVIGTTRTAVAELLANALHQLGCQRALVVCGNNELDEVSLWGETVVFEVSPAGVLHQVWRADLLGLPECRVEALRVNNAAESAEIIRRVFAGEPGPARDMVIANAAAGLLAANRANSIQTAIPIARETIDSGAVSELCETLRTWTNTL
ncbi:anthranilate phosphoribosyltransferase [Schlesneria paludicola]|uniref:anthranilate phosphoribosyltransferase n=1 Tax=Schlesneria paludicola TaxID=360056 RepID=UPI00029A6D8A|nr:anthranilate phosphoribosyltransferase [Schlesneria paludicola]